MSKLHLSLVMLFLAAAGGYGGWRGRDLLSDWSLLLFLVPPLAFGVVTTFLEWRRNPYWISIQIGLATTVLAIAMIGGTALILAWMMSEMTAKWSEPIARAIFGFGMVAFVGVVLWFNKSAANKIEPTESPESKKSGELNRNSRER